MTAGAPSVALKTAVGVGSVSGAGALLAFHPAVAIVVVATMSAVALLVLVLVVAPAIWSRKPARRRAAGEVIDKLGTFVRRPG